MKEALFDQKSVFFFDPYLSDSKKALNQSHFLHPAETFEFGNFPKSPPIQVPEMPGRFYPVVKREAESESGSIH